MPPISHPLRGDTYERLLQLIMSGKLAEDTRIVESVLCTELGVSRTPVREALFRLEQEGLVKQDPARGFSVMPLSAREVREIYPIIWTLEVLAVQLTDSAFHTAALKKLNRAMDNSKTAENRHLNDDKWHEELVATCKNKRLVNQLKVLKQSAHRYEIAYMRQTDKVDMSLKHHHRIVLALEKGNINDAAILLEEHWRFGMQTLLDWLDWEDR